MLHSCFTTVLQDETQSRFDLRRTTMKTTDRNRKLMMLGGLGLGLAMLGRKRRWRRYAMSQVMGGGYGGPWGRFGGYGHGGPGGGRPAVALAPCVEAGLEASHDRAPGTVAPPGARPSHSGPA